MLAMKLYEAKECSKASKVHVHLEDDVIVLDITTIISEHTHVASQTFRTTTYGLRPKKKKAWEAFIKQKMLGQHTSLAQDWVVIMDHQLMWAMDLL